MLVIFSYIRCLSNIRMISPQQSYSYAERLKMLWKEKNSDTYSTALWPMALPHGYPLGFLFPSILTIRKICQQLFGEDTDYLEFAKQLTGERGVLLGVTTFQLIEHLEKNGMVVMTKEQLRQCWFYRFQEFMESLWLKKNKNREATFFDYLDLIC